MDGFLTRGWGNIVIYLMLNPIANAVPCVWLLQFKLHELKANCKLYIERFKRRYNCGVIALNQLDLELDGGFTLKGAFLARQLQVMGLSDRARGE